MKNPYCCLLLACFIAALPVSAQNNTENARGRKTAKIQYGTASYYSNKFQGRTTAMGEPYDKNKMTCAHNSLPLGTWIKVTNLRNGKSVVVRITDRLHHKNKRLVDLSRIAASKLGYLSRGLTRVKVEVLGKKHPSA
jgi:rare lipoprotein A